MARSATVGALNTVMGIDTSPMDAGLKRAEKKIAGLDFGKAVSAGLGDVKKSLGSTAAGVGALGAALGALGVAGLGVGAALAGAFAGVRDAAAFGDDIADTAKKLAVSTDTLQEYRFAVHALGGAYEDADKALDGFQKAFGAAQAKLTKKAVKPFEALGLDPDSFATVDEAFRATIDKIAALESTAEQAAIAEKLGIGDMLPALREGTAEIDRLRVAAHSLGFVMDADLVQRAGDANDKFEDLTRILDVQFKSTMVELAPLILGLAEALAKAAKAGREFFGEMDRLGALDGALAAIPAVGPMLSSAAKSRRQGAYNAAVADRVASQKKGIAELLAGRLNVKATGGASLKPPGAGGGGGGGVSAADRAANGEAALSAAQRAELDARMALTRNIAQLAALRQAEIDADLAEQNRRLDRDAAEGRIDKAVAEKAKALNAQAAAARKELVAREADAALEDSVVRSREEIDRYYDEIARIESELATSAASRNAIEKKLLMAQQDTERRRLEHDQAQLVIAGERTQSEADAYLASQRDLHAAQQRAQAVEQQARIVQEAADLAAAREAAELRLMETEADAALTSLGRLVIEKRILDLRQKAERRELEVQRDLAKTDPERAAAQAQLDVLDRVHANERKLLDGAEALVGAFEDGRDSLTDMFQAFDRGDWGSAVMGLMRAFELAQTAMNRMASSADRVSAAASIAAAAGNAIGGTAGSTISGAASGAATGFALGGPIGAGIGAVIGGIGGFLSGNKAKKRRRAQAKAEAERRAAELAAAKRQLEIRLMELSGDSAGALAAAREEELKGMDASLQALQKEVWAKEDAAEAAAKAAALVEARTALENELMRLQGDDAGALARERAAALAELDASLRPLQQAIYDVIDANAAREESERQLAEAEAAWSAEQQRHADAVDAARDQVREALERDVDALESAAERMGDLADELKSLNDDLRRGALAANPGGSLEAARAAFQKVAARVASGDSGALSDLARVSQDFAEASNRGARSAEENARNQAQIRRSLSAGETLARAQVDAAQQQIDALKALYSPIVGIEAGVKTLGEAMDALAEAIIAQSAVNRAAADSLEAMRASLEAPVPSAANLNTAPATTADLAPIDPGGVAAAVSAQMAAPAVDVTEPGAMTDLATLNDTLGRVLIATEAGALTNTRVLQLFRRWDGDGMPDVRIVA